MSGVRGGNAEKVSEDNLQAASAAPEEKSKQKPQSELNCKIPILFLLEKTVNNKHFMRMIF